MSEFMLASFKILHITFSSNCNNCIIIHPLKIVVVLHETSHHNMHKSEYPFQINTTHFKFSIKIITKIYIHNIVFNRGINYLNKQRVFSRCNPSFHVVKPVSEITCICCSIPCFFNFFIKLEKKNKIINL